MLLGLGIPFLYFMIVSGFVPFFNKKNKAVCSSCNNAGYYSRCHRDHGAGAFFIALVWPFALVGYLVSERLEGGMSRVEKRRAKEIAKAEHEAELAKIAAKTTRDLEIANGIVQASPEKVKSARRALGEEYSYGEEDDLEFMLLDAQARKPKTKGGRVWHVSD